MRITCCKYFANKTLFFLILNISVYPKNISLRIRESCSRFIIYSTVKCGYPFNGNRDLKFYELRIYKIISDQLKKSVLLIHFF